MPESGYNTIQHYYRNTTGGDPSLAQGELAINTFDESLWYADHDGDAYEVPLINLIGTTGVVQTQLNAKAPLASPNFTGDIEIENIKIDGNTISSTNTNGDITIDPHGTGNVLIGNFEFNADATVGTSQDNHVLTYDHSTTSWGPEAASGGGGSGTVTSVTAGTGLTQSGTSTVNPTINAIGGNGITANADDLEVTAAQTTITSMYHSSLAIGYGSSHANIDFSTDNQINFDIDGTAQIVLKDGVLEPVTNDDVDLGSSSKEFNDLYLGGDLIASDAVFSVQCQIFEIGDGTDTDIDMRFNANSASGHLWWMEDEDYFKFSDNVTMDAGLVVKNGSSSSGYVKLYENSSNGSHYITIKPPNLTETYDWKYPTASGSSGNILTTDGSGVLSWTNDISGNAGTVTNGVYTTSKISVLAATTSAELAGVISNETGSGSLVFATSPTLVTPALGTPASGVLSNCSGLAGISGTLGTGNGGTGATSLSNLITLTTHTSGNYVATITGGDGITSSAATSGEGTTHSLSATDVLYASAGLGGPDNLDTLTNDSASGDKLLIYDITGTPAWKQITAANLFTNHGGGGGGVEIASGDINNRVMTSDGTGDSLIGEGNLTFDGTTLTNSAGGIVDSAGQVMSAFSMDQGFALAGFGNSTFGSGVLAMSYVGGPSDERLKTEVSTLEYGLNEIKAISPKWYKYDETAFNSSGLALPIPTDHEHKDAYYNEQRYGFMAGDVKTVMPKLVSKIEDDKDYETYDKDALIFVLINAVKELEARLATLEAA